MDQIEFYLEMCMRAIDDMDQVEIILEKCMRVVDWSILRKHLPPGINFTPTETNLIDLLETKASSGDKHVFPGITSSFDIYQHDPDNLHKQEGVVCHGGKMYIFTPLTRKAAGGGRVKRETPNGRWVLSGSKKNDLIKNGRGSRVGMKSCLTFSRKSKNHGKNHWLMQEFRLTAVDHLVLCVVYKKKKDDDDDDENNNNNEATPISEDNADDENKILINGENEENLIKESSSSVPSSHQQPQFSAPPDQNQTHQFINGSSPSPVHQIQNQNHQLNNGYSVSTQNQDYDPETGIQPVNEYSVPPIPTYHQNQTHQFINGTSPSPVHQIQNQNRNHQLSNGYSVSTQMQDYDPEIGIQPVNKYSVSPIPTYHQNQTQILTNGSILPDPRYQPNDLLRQFSDNQSRVWTPDVEFGRRTELIMTSSSSSSSSNGGNCSSNGDLNDMFIQKWTINDQQQQRKRQADSELDLYFSGRTVRKL